MENSRYLKLGEEILEKLEPEVKVFIGEPQVKKIKAEFNRYCIIMEKYVTNHQINEENERKQLEEKLREHEKN